MAKKKKHYRSIKSERQRIKDEFLATGNTAARRGLEDSDMIREDHASMANLPQQAFIKPYKNPTYGHEMGIDDTITGIDLQIEDDSDEMKKYSYPEKY